MPHGELSPLSRDLESNDAGMRDAVRGVLKQMVQWAITTSPIHQNVSLADLERAHSVLYKLSVTTLAEDLSSVKAKQSKGSYVFLSYSTNFDIFIIPLTEIFFLQKIIILRMFNFSLFIFKSNICIALSCMLISLAWR